MPSRRWAVFISGRGSNLGALLSLVDDIDVRVVVSSTKLAYGLLRAKRAGVRRVLTPLIATGTRAGRIDWDTLNLQLRAAGITDVFLAGFMKIVPAKFVTLWQGHIFNLHPSLLPAYPGLDSISRAYMDRAPIGVTVHEVDQGVDTGFRICSRRSFSEEELKDNSLSTLPTIEFKVHRDEQRVVAAAVLRSLRWRHHES